MGYSCTKSRIHIKYKTIYTNMSTIYVHVWIIQLVVFLQKVQYSLKMSIRRACSFFILMHVTIKITILNYSGRPKSEPPWQDVLRLVVPDGAAPDSRHRHPVRLGQAATGRWQTGQFRRDIFFIIKIFILKYDIYSE